MFTRFPAWFRCPCFALFSLVFLGLSSPPPAHAQAPSYLLTDLGNFGTDQYGANSSYAIAINSAGQIAGGSDVYDAVYTKNGPEAFLYNSNRLTALGNLGVDDMGHFSSVSVAINNVGQIAGSSDVYDTNHTKKGTDAFLYSNGAMIDLGSLGADKYGNGNSAAFSLNHAGEVIGTSTVYGDDHLYKGGAGFLYSSGQMINLTSAGNFGADLDGIGYSTAVALNNVGQVAGSARLYTVDHVFLANIAFLYSGGQVTNLGGLGTDSSGNYSSSAAAMNEAGQIVGISNVYDANHVYQRQDPFLYSQGTMIDLGNLGTDSSGYTYSSAAAINDSGEVIGTSAIYDANRVYKGNDAFLYRSGKMTDIGRLSVNNTRYSPSKATAINNEGQVIGAYTDNAGGFYHHGSPFQEAFLYTDGITYDLRSLIANGSGWDHLTATGINDSEQIVGYGTYHGHQEAFLLTPRPGRLLWTHLLWTHTSGIGSVWNINEDGTYNYDLYGPYDGWTATQVGAGPDGNTRLLWTHAGGLASLWNLADPHPAQTFLMYGPFDGWAATDMSIGHDNVPCLLWTHTNGTASVWYVAPDGSYVYQTYGPYNGWKAQSVAIDAEGNTRLLWTHAGGLASLWNLTDPQPDQTCFLYGPYDGWNAKSLSIGLDNIPHILWTHTSGLASVWNVDPTGAVTYQLYGPYDGWAATGISVTSGDTVRLLWTHSGGLASLWNLSDTQADRTYQEFGPFDGWSAVSLAAGP